MTDVGCVLLSVGNRPHELRRAVDALLRQHDVSVDVVVVGNGWTPEGLPDRVRAVALPENVGIPEGRNVGAAAVDGEILLFYDDDLEPGDERLLAEAVERFRADPDLAVLQPRAVGPDGGPPARRHVPRLGGRGLERSGDVAWFWEGCSFVRRSAFDAVGGWPGHFFYGHEGIELAWRIIDRGLAVRYAADLTVVNPPAAPFRRPEHQRTNARNRVWVARRNLPHPWLELYLLVWIPATFLRARSRAAVAATAAGFAAGFREPAGPRKPIRWRTVWRLTRLGRPPVV